MDTRVYGSGFEQYTPQEQQRITLGRTVAEEGMVLLENRGALPLAPGSRVALLGVGQLGFLPGGSGSGGTFADYVVKLPEAMVNAGAQVDQPLLSCYTEYCTAQQKELEKVPPFLRRGTIPEMPISRATLQAAAARTDAAIFTISRLAGEGRDRKLESGDYFLSPEEHALMAEARAAFDTLIVVLNICGVIDMEWVDQYHPDGVLVAWIPGQEGASAAADILMGNVTPSGHLSDTIAHRWQDIPSSENFGAWADGFECYIGDENQIPYWGGVGNHEAVPVGKTVVRPIGNRRYTEYQEGLYVGYRYFTTFGVPVRYPFGYGLSYTTFSRQVSDASVTADGVSFSVTVANTGKFSGKDVIQIYLHGAEGSLERPDRELIAFQKTKLLAPGETQVLSFSVPFRAMAVYDEARAAWILQDGENVLYLGENALELAAFFTFDTREAILEQVSNQVEPHHTRPLRQLSKRDPQGTRPIAPPIRADSAEQHGSKKTSDFVSPIMPTESTPYQLLDVKEGRCTMAEFLA